MKRREGVEVGRNLEHLDIFLKCFLWETLYKYSYFVHIIHTNTKSLCRHCNCHIIPGFPGI